MSKAFLNAGWRGVGGTDTFVNLNVPGWRIRLTARLALVERRRASTKRRAGVWERMAKYDRPNGAAQWRTLARRVAKLLAPTVKQRPEVADAIERGRVRMHREGFPTRTSAGGGKVRGMPSRSGAFGWSPAQGKRLAS